MRLLLATLWLLLAGQVLAGPREAYAAARADGRTLPAEEALQTRYLWQPGGLSDADRAVIAYHANQLSRAPDLVPPRLVAPDLLAVCLDHYGWDPAVWEKLADTEPYFTVRAEVVAEVYVARYYPAHYQDGKYYPAGHYRVKAPGKKRIENVPNPQIVDAKTHAALQLLTGSVVPVVRADWWLANTCMQVNLRNVDAGIGYYEWLGIKDRGTFLKLARFKEADADAVGRPVRAVLDRSGVAQHGRQVAGYDALTGKVFATFDADKLEDDNLPTELLRPGVFKHQAEEWFLQASNGLWHFGLFDAAGKRQATAPDFIGPDDSPLRSGRDGRIHVGLSCLRCHVEDGLRPIDDWVRRTFRGRVRNDIVTREEELEYRRLYLSNLDKQLEEGRRRYREALAELNGQAWTSLKNAEQFARYFDRYAHAAVDVGRLALEFGVPVETLTERLQAWSRRGRGLPISLAPLLDGGTVRRETVEDFWAVLGLNVLGLNVLGDG